MEIFDAHAHIYPQKIAKKATQTIGEFYDIKMQTEEGTSELLIKNGKSAGITRFLVHSVATKKEQVAHINDFINEQLKSHAEFIGFMTLHQDLSEEEIYDEVKRCKKLGFYGIKLHPDFQLFNIDDNSVEKIYRVAEHFDFPVLFHTGDDRYTYSAPERLANMCKKYNKVNFIGAHFGGYRCWDRVDCYKGLDNVYFDTSSSLAFIDVSLAKTLIEKFSADKFFFGTDFPMWKADEELARFNKIPLTQNEKESIYSANLKRLLKL